MDLMTTDGIVDHVIDLIHHHFGIFLITVAFGSLLIKSVNSKKPIVPRDFAFIYGIGGLILGYHMWNESKPLVVFMELIGAFISLYLALK